MDLLDTYLKKEGSFSFDTIIEKAFKDEAGDLFITAVASDTKMDHHGDRMSKAALKLMEKQAKAGLPILDNHRSTFPFGKTVDGKVVKLGTSWQLVVTIKLDKRFPESAVIWDEVQSGNSEKQLSIGGMINFDNPKAVVFEEDENGNFVRTINDIVLEHIAATRKDMAANARAGFLDAIAKSLDDHKLDKSFFTGLLFGQIQKTTEKPKHPGKCPTGSHMVGGVCVKKESSKSADSTDNLKEVLDSDTENSAEYDGQEVKGTNMTKEEIAAAELVKKEEAEKAKAEVTKENAETEAEEVSAEETPEVTADEAVETDEVEAEEVATEEVVAETEETEKSLVSKLGGLLKDFITLSEKETASEEVVVTPAVEEEVEVEEEAATEEEVVVEAPIASLKEKLENLTKEEIEEEGIDVNETIANLLAFFSVTEKSDAAKDLILSVLNDSDVAKTTNETIELAKQLTEITSTDVVKSLESSDKAITELSAKVEEQAELIKSLTDRLTGLEKGAGVSHNLGNEEEEVSTEKNKGLFHGHFAQALLKSK